MELTRKKLIEEVQVRANYVLIHGEIRKLSSGLVMVGNNEHIDADIYDIHVVKCGPNVTDLKPGDEIFLSSLSVEPVPVKECPDLKQEFYGYTPESFIKLFIRHENSSKE